MASTKLISGLEERTGKKDRVFQTKDGKKEWLLTREKRANV